MSYEIIAAATLAASALALISLIIKKIPVLVSLPEPENSLGQSLAIRFKKVFERINPFKKFSYDLFLQKILSQIRVWSLRAENKAFHSLQGLREKAKIKKSNLDNDKYWEEVKKTKEEK